MEKSPKIPVANAPMGNMNFLRVLHDGPEIARRADRVGVLPLAALVGNGPKTYLGGVSFFPPLGTLTLCYSTGVHVRGLRGGINHILKKGALDCPVVRLARTPLITMFHCLIADLYLGGGHTRFFI